MEIIKKYKVLLIASVVGLLLSFAVAKSLSKYFSKTYYHSVNQNPFPGLSLDNIGTGYDDITRAVS